MRADLQPHFVADVVDGDGASQWPHLALINARSRASSRELNSVQRFCSVARDGRVSHCGL